MTDRALLAIILSGMAGFFGLLAVAIVGQCGG